MPGIFQNEKEIDCGSDEHIVLPKGVMSSSKFFISFINEGLELAKQPTDGSHENKFLSPAFIDVIKSRCLPYCLFWSSILLGKYLIF